jgi:hypothetical protein
MIVASNLIERMVAALDAEGSDRYKFDRDFKPAINYAIEYYVAVFNAAFGEKKLSEENLRELTRTRVFQTSKYSRIRFNPADLGDEIWTILVVAPEPTLDPQINPLINPSPKDSIFITGDQTIFVKSKYSANRLSLEEWNENEENIFMPGNVTLQNKFKQYAYKGFVHFKEGELSNEIIDEIEIRPYLDNQLVGVTYLRFPPLIDADDDEIYYPKTMKNLLVNQALKFISKKQGDGTNLYTVEERDIQMLVSLMA